MKHLVTTFAMIALFATACTKSGSLSAFDDGVISGNRNHDELHRNVGDNSIPTTSIPGAVKLSFNQHYPGAVKVQWVILNNRFYQATFYFEDAHWQSIFLADGTLVSEDHD